MRNSLRKALILLICCITALTSCALKEQEMPAIGKSLELVDNNRITVSSARIYGLNASVELDLDFSDYSLSQLSEIYLSYYSSKIICDIEKTIDANNGVNVFAPTYSGNHCLLVFTDDKFDEITDVSIMSIWFVINTVGEAENKIGVLLT